MYQKLVKILRRFFTDAQIYKYGFNWSSMYKRTTGKIIRVSDDLRRVTVKIPINYKNRNYVGSIFGGSLFSSTDPIFMIQLINILGDDYVVWDKDATIKYKRPAREDVYAKFLISESEITQIIKDVAINNETDFVKKLNIVTENGVIIAELTKTLYIANKSYYKAKRKQKAQKK